MDTMTRSKEPLVIDGQPVERSYEQSFADLKNPSPRPKHRPTRFTPEQREEWIRQQREELEQLKKDVQIVDYARDNGYTLKRVGARYYELERHSSSRIDPVRNIFYYNAANVRGSIVDFIKFVHPKMDDEAAIKELKAYANVPDRRFSPPPNQEKFVPRIFELPEKLGEKYSRLYAYLSKSRCIEYSVICDMVKRGMLYEDKRHNCVFAGYDKEGVPGYAGLRTTATEGTFKGEVAGSMKDISWFVSHGAKSLFITEAPIDAMSVMTLFKHYGMDYKRFDYLPLGGTALNALRRIMKENPNQYDRIYLGSDNDDAGHSVRTEARKYLQEIGFSGKILDKIPTQGKDWNQELCQRTEFMQQEKTIRKNIEQANER